MTEPYVGRGRPRHDEPRREGMKAEAARRGVSVWQVRKERGASHGNLSTQIGGRLLSEVDTDGVPS